MEGFPFVHRETVRFRDLDGMGHVNNAVYSTYLEQARLAWFGEDEELAKQVGVAAKPPRLLSGSASAATGDCTRSQSRPIPDRRRQRLSA
jgi:Thioesterase-like superfamily